jgi:cobalt/nickel transport system permease protein
MLALLPVVPWAVHLSDGVLSWPWLAGGFALIAVLALAAAYRVRDEEVPRIALLTAAFFVASSIHLKLGPTSVHLLLAGLVGVVLGRRAPLAILIGVAMQAAFIPHGGFTTIGVNACIQAVPALLAGAVFAHLARLPWGQHPAWRAGLVAASAVLWSASLIAAFVILWTSPLADLVRFSPEAGLVVWVTNLDPIRDVLRHPATLAGVTVVALACAWGERRLGNAPEFPLGLLIGTVSVLLTAGLAGLVLILDGADRWSTYATAVFLAHLPLALLEGLVLGFTVGFLARVKPELLRLPTRQEANSEPAPAPVALKQGTSTLLALAALLLGASPALAHGLEVNYQIDRVKKTVQLTAFFETGDAPQNGSVQVRRVDGSLVAEGPLDSGGRFEFAYEQAEDLKVRINVPGHPEVVLISASELAIGEARRSYPRSRWRDLALGVSFVLALASFVLSLRTHRRVREISEAMRRETRSA